MRRRRRSCLSLLFPFFSHEHGCLRPTTQSPHSWVGPTFRCFLLPPPLFLIKCSAAEAGERDAGRRKWREREKKEGNFHSPCKEVEVEVEISDTERLPPSVSPAPQKKATGKGRSRIHTRSYGRRRRLVVPKEGTFFVFFLLPTASHFWGE